MSDGTPRLGRRGFLGLAAGGAATLGAAGVGWRLFGSDDPAPSAPSSTVDRPSPDAATTAIGERYLDVTPAERTATDLRGLLPASLGALSAGEGTDAVASAATADFETGRTIELDGWLLSVTECRWAALAVVG